MDQLELSYLSKNFLFDGFDEAETKKCLDRCHRLNYSSGDLIHSSKKQSHGIGIIISGRAKIVSGRGDTLLRVLKDGDMFGAASVFAIGDDNRTAVIASGACSVLFIPEEVIKDILYEHPEASVKYISFLSERINFLNVLISSITAGDALAKVAGFLLSLDCDDNCRAIIKYSFTEVASKLNIGRASLYRTIDRFVNAGYIKRDKDTVFILDRDSLEDIVFKK